MASPTARRLRSEPTEAEKRLWMRVRRRQRDGERTRWLARRGYRVVRFRNNEVFENVEAVLDGIRAAVEPPP